jgi:hypothetical protein
MYGFLRLVSEILDDLYGFLRLESEILDDLFGFLRLVSEILDDLYAFLRMESEILDDLYGFLTLGSNIPDVLYGFLNQIPHLATGHLAASQARKKDSVSFVQKAILTGGVGLVRAQHSNWSPAGQGRRWAEALL